MLAYPSSRRSILYYTKHNISKTTGKIIPYS